MAGTAYDHELLTRKQHQILNVRKVSSNIYNVGTDTAADVVATEDELDEEAQLPRVLWVGIRPPEGCQAHRVLPSVLEPSRKRQRTASGQAAKDPRGKGQSITDLITKNFYLTSPDSKALRVVVAFKPVTKFIKVFVLVNQKDGLWEARSITMAGCHFFREFRDDTLSKKTARNQGGQRRS